MAFLHHQLSGHEPTVLSVSRKRLVVVFAVFALSFTAISARLVALTLKPNPVVTASRSVKTSPPSARPDIIDRNGELLATDIQTSSLFADPAKVLDADDAIEKIAKLFPDIDKQKMLERLADEKKRFVWIKRGLSPAQQAKVHNLGIPGIGFEQEPRRVYPTGKTASHILGYVDIDNKGLSGIEKHIDHISGLYFPKTQDPDNKTNIKLSLDLGVQHVLREEIQKAIQQYQAKAAAGVVIDVISGEILAMSSLPDFDPNIRNQALEKDAFDRMTTGSYELGSVFKTFTTAMALDLGVVALEDSYDTRNPIRIASHKIDDYHAKRRDLNISEIFIYSSNIGAARMAMDVGIDRHKAFLKRVGLLDPVRTELGALRQPSFPKHWGDVHTMTIAFGHGLSVSPLQFAISAAALFNGGYKVEPTFLYRSREEGRARAEKVLKSETSHILRRLMRLNVTDGTGKRAEAIGYRVGGKTGTAEKIENGRYSKNALITTFLSLFPSDDPAYLVFIMIDEPEVSDGTGQRPTAGVNAAPLTSQIVSRIAPILNVAPNINTQAKIDEHIPATY